MLDIFFFFGEMLTSALRALFKDFR